MDKTSKEKPTEEVSELQFIVSAMGAISLASIFYLGSKADRNGLETLAAILFTTAIPLLSVTMLMIKSATVDRSSVKPPLIFTLIGMVSSLFGITLLFWGISPLVVSPFLLSTGTACWLWFSFEKKLKLEQAQKEPELSADTEGH